MLIETSKICRKPPNRWEKYNIQYISNTTNIHYRKIVLMKTRTIAPSSGTMLRVDVEVPNIIHELGNCDI
jgi:hypothetical protein